MRRAGEHALAGPRWPALVRISQFVQYKCRPATTCSAIKAHAQRMRGNRRHATRTDPSPTYRDIAAVSPSSSFDPS